MKMARGKHRAREENGAPTAPCARIGKKNGENVWVHNFLFCQVNNAKPLEIDSFYLCHIHL
jgi:hypothetical protein